MKNGKITFAAMALSALLILCCFFGCSNDQSSQANDSDAQNSTQTNQENSEASTYLLQIEHYEELIKELETRILNIKEENYIAISEYQLEIASLNKKIDLLTSEIEFDNNQQNTENTPPSQPQLNFRDENDTEATAQSQYVYKNHNGVITITGYKGYAETVDIPSKIEGLPVTSIGECAFKGSTVKKIYIPESAEYIDWFAFYECKDLAEIHIPSSVKEIGYGAFANCSSSLVIVCAKGSYAETFAQSWGIASRSK